MLMVNLLNVLVLIILEIECLPLWKDYFEMDRKNEKNKLENIYQSSIGVENTFNDGTALKKNRCKVGIDIAMEKPNVNLCFIIDEIDMESVVEKIKSSYTDSELRYVYRNWYRLKDKFIFIYEGKTVAAP